MLEGKFGTPESAILTWKPNTPVLVSEEDDAQKLLKLLDALDDCDDVQNVVGNFELPQEFMDKFANN